MFRTLILIIAFTFASVGLGASDADASTYHYYCGPSAIGGDGGTIYRYYHAPGGGLIYSGSFYVGEWGYTVVYGC